MNSNVLERTTSAGMARAYYAVTMSLRTDFSDNLARIRKARGLTQSDLADRAGLSLGAVRAYEQRVNWPEPERMELICKALQTTPAELLRSSASKAKEIPLEQVLAVQDKVSELIEMLGVAGLLPSRERASKKRA